MFIVDPYSTYAYMTYPYDYTGLPRNDTGPLCPLAAPPDVVLNIPNLSVQSITLNVADLNAKLALNARALSLVTINAGVNVSISDVLLQIQGVRAAARLEVRLENVKKIVNRVLRAIDLAPVLCVLGATTGSALQGLGGTLSGVTSGVGSLVNGTVSGVGGVASGVTGAVSSVATAAPGILATAAGTTGAAR